MDESRIKNYEDKLEHKKSLNVMDKANRFQKQKYLKSCNIFDEDILEELEDFEINKYFEMACSPKKIIRDELIDELKRMGYYCSITKITIDKNKTIPIFSKDELFKMSLKDIKELENNVWEYNKKLTKIIKYLELED